MKKYLLIVLTLSMIACNKSNITFNHHWEAEAYHDNRAVSAAFTCDKPDYLGIDTIDLTNTILVDSTKFYPEAGSIVFDPGGKVSGNRYYHRLRVQID